VGEPTVFTAEGLTQYLSEAAVVSLAECLAALGGPGSRLLVNFGLSFAATDTWRSRVIGLVGRASLAASGEPARYTPASQDATDLLRRTGWSASTLMSCPAAVQHYLAGTSLRTTTLNPQSCLVAAIRT
jgi:O-methyltransferase involved in polyketide biosynthesis